MINNLVKKTQVLLIFRVLALIGFVLALFVLYFGSIKLIFNITNSWIMFILWTLWWPFLYISLLFLGRFWCGFICPVGLVNEIGNSINKVKRNYLINYSWLPFAILIVVVFWEQISGLFFSTKLTMLFLLGFFILAFIIGMILPRWGFCKYVCPVGTILGVFSRLSFVGLRTNKDICKNCKTKECIMGGKTEPCPLFNNVPEISSNQNCLLCTNCIKNCPYESAKLCFVKPGEELKTKSGFNLAESFFIVALLGLAILLTSKGSEISRFFIKGLNLSGALLRAWDFVFWIGGFILLYFLISYILSKSNKKFGNYKNDLINGGYVLLPLAFSIMFFLIVFGFITPLTNIKESWIAITKYALLFIGGIWSKKINSSLFKGRESTYRIFIILLLVFWISIIIPGPLNVFESNLNVYVVENNGVVNISAFSMGFEPEIIKAKAGTSFKINITSTDIAHSFDIDDLDIHMSFKGKHDMIISLYNLEAGEYEYYCAIPGHKEAGMKGVLIVE